MNNKYVFWWDSPCKGIIGILNFFCENISKESITITGDLGSFRESMGWDNKDKLFRNHIVIPRNKLWKVKTKEKFNEYKEGYIHIFGGITRNKTAHLVKLANNYNVRFCIMSENPANLHFGIMKIIKDSYISIFLPIYSKYLAGKTELVFCLCGHKSRFLNYFYKIGYSRNKIIPYGYWTDTKYENINEVDGNKPITLFCPGLLERYKRIDLLILAIDTLVKRGFSNFECHIIGDGSQKYYLNKMVRERNLGNLVIFDGVLNEKHTLITKSDILIAPGSVEPWGIRINEAIQRAQVVISSEGVGASYLIEESGGGKVFKLASYKDLADSIQYYLEDFSRINIAKRRNYEFRDKISCEVKAKELFSYLDKL